MKAKRPEMKNCKTLINFIIIFFIGLGLLFLNACGEDDPEPIQSGPVAPALSSPANAAMDQPLTPTLRWEAAVAESGVKEYAVYFGKEENPSTLVASGVETSLTFTSALDNSTKYYWKVQVTDKLGLTATSEIFSFTTVGESGFKIADEEFGKALEAQGYAADIEGDYILDMEAIASVTLLDLGGASSAPLDIKDINGIQFFTALRSLDLDYTSITNLDLSNNANLDTLQFTNGADNTANFLTTMSLPNGMLRIRIFRHNLASFDASGFADLEYLRLDGDNIPNAAVGGVTNAMSSLTLDENVNTKLTHLDMGANLDETGSQIFYQVSLQIFDQLTSEGAGNKDGVIPPPLFSILSVNPADGASDIPVDPTIQVTFSDDLDASQFTYTLTQGSNTIATTASVDGAVLSIAPSANLANSTSYTLEIAEAVGLNGASIEESATYSFTTIAAGEISLVSVTISSNTLSNSASVSQIDRSGVVLGTFSSSVANTFSAASYTLTRGGATVASTFTLDGSVVEIKPASALDAAADYTLTILSAMPIADNGGSLDADEVFAFTTGHYLAGDGGMSYPFQISTGEELDSVRLHLAANFVLKTNVDLFPYLTGSGWDPIDAFTGSFDGDRKVIQNLWITSGTSFAGLFGEDTEGSIFDLGLTIHSTGILGSDRAGALIGELNGGTVSKCYVTGGGVATNVGGTASRTGGFVGYITAGSISQCFTTVDVGGTEIAGSMIADRVGGFVGGIGSGFGGITDSYATGNVSGDADTGGFLGWANGSANFLLLKNVYSSGSVTTTDGTTSGIFSGNDLDGQTVTTCYFNSEATLTGGNSAISITDLSGVAFSANGKSASSFPGLESAVWSFNTSGISGSSGPVLIWE